MPAPDTDERRTLPFSDTLRKLRRGRTHSELSRELQDLVQAVTTTGRQGTLTLTLKVSRSKATGMVEIDDTVKVKLPEPQRDASMFFADDDGNLHRSDPNQDELPGIRAASDDDTRREAL